MGIKRLIYFSRVAEFGSVKAAAENIHISQPSLSRQMRMLEEELGIKLFERHHRGMKLTAEGKGFYDRIAAPVREIELTLKETRSSALGKKANLCLGLPATVGHIMAGPLTQKVARGTAGINLQITEGSLINLANAMSRGELDVAILLGPAEDWPTMEWTTALKGLHVEDLLCEDLVLVGSRESELKPDQPVEYELLGKIPLVVSSYMSNLDGYISKNFKPLKSSRENENNNVISDSFQLTKDYVESGLAYAALPYSSVISDYESGRITYAPIQNPTFTRSLVIVTNPSADSYPAVKKLKAFIFETISELFTSKKWQAKILFAPDTKLTRNNSAAP